MFSFGTVDSLEPNYRKHTVSETSCREILTIDLLNVQTVHKYLYFCSYFDAPDKTEETNKKRNAFVTTFCKDSHYLNDTFFFNKEASGITIPMLSMISLLEKYHLFNRISSTLSLRELSNFYLNRIIEEYDLLFSDILSLSFGSLSDPYFAGFYLFNILAGGRLNYLESVIRCNGCSGYVKYTFFQHRPFRMQTFYRKYGNNYAEKRGYKYMGEAFRCSAVMSNEQDARIINPERINPGSTPTI